MKHLVEYKLWGSEIPYFIEDGGYFSLDGKLVGVTKDTEKCFIPKLASSGGDLVDFTLDSFKVYLKARTMYKNTLIPMQATEMTDNEKEQLAESFWLSKGL